MPEDATPHSDYALERDGPGGRVVFATSGTGEANHQQPTPQNGQVVYRADSRTAGRQPQSLGGRVSPVEDLRKNECGSASQGRNTNQANDRVEDASTMPAARERLPCMEMSQELSFAGPHAPCACGAARFP